MALNILDYVIVVYISIHSLFGQCCGQCPWSRELLDLHSDCICGYNNVQRLSIQCSPINFTRLMTSIHISVQKVPIDLLYINNSTIANIPAGVFKNLDLLNLHISNSKIDSISNDAFVGLEDKLISLTLSNTEISFIPVLQIQTLRSLKILDLSGNNIRHIPDNSFSNMQLSTLKLSDNDLTISDAAFRGLETTLKNLNLKATNLKTIPLAISNLSSLAFLDLAQNKIKDIEPDFMINLHSLTAVNLERNKLQRLHDRAFIGINDSLSSLSLLNNLLVDFPTQAISELTALRVLDLGFNAIQHLPNDSFRDNVLLTLLALDGNPLKTIPLGAFHNLNNTLRGLSIGGKHLECDCKLRWISEWVRDNNLQVTSRERNPQFCGFPEYLRKRNFLHLNPSDFVCENETHSQHNVITKKSASLDILTTISQQISSQFITNPEVLSLSSSHTKLHTAKQITETTPMFDLKESSSPVVTTMTTTSTSKKVETLKNSPLSRAIDRYGNENIKILNAIFHNDSILIEWESLKPNPVGYQVVHRFFGSREYKKGPLLGPKQRKYNTQHIPPNECIVICVLSLTDNSPNKMDNIPASHCREIRRDRHRISDLDKIVIGVSAAVCVFVVCAVFVFSCCYNKGSKSSTKTISPIMKSDNEWETVSVYSARSIPRARMYHMDNAANSTHNLALDDSRSHISNCYQTSNAYMKHRSLADGQSNRSYSVSQLSHRMHNMNGVNHNTELTKSHSHSLSHNSLSAHNSINTSDCKHKSKSNHNQLMSSSSLHSLTEYDSEWNFGSSARISNWKDNELDIYVDKNYVISTNNKNRYRNPI